MTIFQPPIDGIGIISDLLLQCVIMNNFIYRSPYIFLPFCLWNRFTEVGLVIKKKNAGVILLEMTKFSFIGTINILHCHQQCTRTGAGVSCGKNVCANLGE